MKDKRLSLTTGTNRGLM